MTKTSQLFKIKRLTRRSTMLQSIIVVPCYNEELRLPMQCFRDFVERHTETRFCMVNDGSQDATLVMLYRLKTEYPDRFLILNLPQNQGKAEAVRQGMCAAFEYDPEYVGYWDADLAAPLEAISQFQAVLDRRPETHMVIGTRLPLLGHAVGRGLLRYCLGRLFAWSAASILGLRIYDTQCGHKLFRVDDKLRKIFQTPFHARWIFDVELFARWIGNRTRNCLRQAQDSIYELPLDAWNDVAGSKLKPFDFFRAFFELANIGWIFWNAPAHLASTTEEGKIDAPQMGAPIQPVPPANLRRAA
ncbi:MAG: glycosyl transferase family 2 [Planctomycetaceae bacterium]|nr:glycosyl transferase family 2 [Planctomycetaceae bacterium]